MCSEGPPVKARQGASGTAGCCPLYHEAVELVGRRWTGAILRVLMDGPLRFSQISHAVPELSDRLLSERMKELESRRIVERRVIPGPPLRVEYELSRMGHELEPALGELERWAHRWLQAGRRAPAAPAADEAALIETGATVRASGSRMPARVSGR